LAFSASSENDSLPMPPWMMPGLFDAEFDLAALGALTASRRSG
jgi:hypothetical protein